MKKEYNFLYTGYLLCNLDSEEIIKWADKKILEGDDSQEIMNLSLSRGNSNIIISELKALCEYQLIDNIDIYYFSLYRKLLEQKAVICNVIGEQMCALYRNDFIIDEERRLYCSSLTDYFDLIKEGFKGNMNLPKDLIIFLKDFDSPIDIFKELNFKIGNCNVASLDS